MAEFEEAGCPGAVGSTNVTHIMLEKVSYRMRQAHIGFKMSHAARACNMTVNHQPWMLSTTHGHPAQQCFQPLHRGSATLQLVWFAQGVCDPVACLLNHSFLPSILPSLCFLVCASFLL
jgi:hypothetical protein